MRRLLNAEAGLEVVAEAGDLRETMRHVGAYRPTLLVLDLSMRGGSGLEAIPRLLDASQSTAIVVLTMHNEPAVAREALRAGALGYVLKEAAATELVQALHAAIAGREYLDPRLGARIAQLRSIAATPDRLTRRELQVLKLVALGHTNPEIAHKLDLGVRTVGTYRGHIHDKVRVSSRAELTAYARARSAHPLDLAARTLTEGGVVYCAENARLLGGASRPRRCCESLGTSAGPDRRRRATRAVLLPAPTRCWSTRSRSSPASTPRPGRSDPASGLPGRRQLLISQRTHIP
ncbi:MAG: response regulator transcription factor [Solirubrobacteraceae bacterium]